MNVTSVGFAVAAAAMLASCAQQAGPSAAAGRQCFYAGQVNDFSAVGDSAVNIRVGTNSFYRLDLTGTCTNIDWANSVALQTRGGNPWICDAADADLIVPGRTGGTCIVSAIRPITREEWVANTRR